MAIPLFSTIMYKSSMLLERIKTSLWLPKIIFTTTITLFLLSGILVYGYVTTSPSVMIEDGAKIMDQLTYKVITNSGN